MPVPAAVQFTAPAMLGGLALLSLPLIAHLLHRRARRKVVFPTIRLLQASAATQSRLFRMRRWILLLLRAAAAALLVGAFARPIWQEAAATSGPADGAAALVLVVDASASTTQRAEGVSLAERLKAAGNRAIGSLRSGTDVANVVVASARPEPVFSRLSPNLPALRDELNRLQPTYERADFASAIAEAGKLLQGHGSGHREVVVLSDMQATNWREAFAGSDASRLLPPGTRVTVIEPDAPVPDNVTLSDPRHFPPQPLADRPLQLSVRVSNAVPRTKQVRVVAEAGDRVVGEQTVTVAAGERRDVAFDTTFTGEGTQRVTFRAAADGLEADDRAYLVVRPKARLAAVIVSDESPDEPGTAAYFLARALAPHGDVHDRYEVRHLTSDQVDPARLADAAAMFVGRVENLGPGPARVLAEYVRQGGGLGVFCGEGNVPRTLQTLDEAAGEGGWLPWRAGAERDLGKNDDSLHLTSGKWQSRLLREFDEQSQVAISEIRFIRVWTVVRPKADVEDLLAFSDGTPALTARRVGGGQVLLANFSPSLGSSDLGKYGTFVALVQNLAMQLRPSAASVSSAAVGQPYRFSEPVTAGAGETLQVFDPQGQPASAAATAEGGRSSVQIERPRLPGFYRVEVGGEERAAAAINLDPREGDLRRIARDDLLRMFDAAGGATEVRQASGWEPIVNPGGRPLWGWFVVAAMAFVGAELACVGLWGR